MKLRYTLALSLLLAGCASKTVSMTTPSASSDTIIVTDAFGETTLNKKPERVVTIGWENQDTPLALGVIPVGVSAANYGKVSEDKLHPWTKEAFTKLGEDKPNVLP